VQCEKIEKKTAVKKGKRNKKNRKKGNKGIKMKK
jgi:hypothetical protein